MMFLHRLYPNPKQYFGLGNGYSFYAWINFYRFKILKEGKSN